MQDTKNNEEKLKQSISEKKEQLDILNKVLCEVVKDEEKEEKEHEEEVLNTLEQELEKIYKQI